MLLPFRDACALSGGARRARETWRRALDCKTLSPKASGCCTLQVLTPYVAASFGRVYPGGAPLIDLPAVNQPLLKLIASWEEPPPPAATGVAPLLHLWFAIHPIPTVVLYLPLSLFPRYRSSAFTSKILLEGCSRLATTCSVSAFTP